MPALAGTSAATQRQQQMHQQVVTWDRFLVAAGVLVTTIQTSRSIMQPGEYVQSGMQYKQPLRWQTSQPFCCCSHAYGLVLLQA